MSIIETSKAVSRRAVVEATLLVVLLASLAAWLWLPARVPQGQQPLASLEAPATPQFAAAFDDVPTGPRLVLLLSPT